MLRFLVLALGLALVVPARAATREQTAAVVTQAVDGFIRPAYRAFRDRTLALVADTDKLCQSPTNDTLNTARDSFRRAVGTWAQAEVIRFGPVTDENRLDRILFYPDRLGFASRQIRAVLLSKDPRFTDPAHLANESPTVQGFGALEFVLFGNDSDALATPGGAFRCAYGRAIAGNLAAIASAVDKAWSDREGFAARWVSPGPDNPLFPTPDAALGALVGTFTTSVAWLRDTRLDTILGPLPRQSVFSLSNATVVVIGGNLSGLSSLLEASNLETVLPADGAWIENTLRFEFSNASRAAGDLDGRSVGDILADARLKARLGYLRLVTASLSDIFRTRLEPALGLAPGAN